jgi:hypothetical protein
MSQLPDWKPFRFKLTRCPHCGHRLNACSTLGEDRPPNPGDLSVCMGCGQVVRFGPKLKLQRVPASVIAALLPDERAELQEVLDKVRGFIAHEEG